MKTRPLIPCVKSYEINKQKLTKSRIEASIDNKLRLMAIFSFSLLLRLRSVTINPGQIAFTDILNSPSSLAAVLVNAITPAFDAV